jgi:ribosomal protein S18 acetylase RimI-like enzyme
VDVTIRRLRSGDDATACAVATTFKASAVPRSRAGKFLANSANYLVVADVDGDPVGFLIAYRLERLDRPAPQLFVYEIGVAPEYQRRHIGTRLMEFVRGVVETEVFMEAFVFTSRSNEAAVGLYRETGGQVEDDMGVLFVYPGAA